MKREDHLATLADLDRHFNDMSGMFKKNVFNKFINCGAAEHWLRAQVETGLSPNHNSQ